MDYYESVREPSAGGGGSVLIVNGALAYFFYSYTYSNPDNSACYATRGIVAAYASMPGPLYSDVSA